MAWWLCGCGGWGSGEPQELQPGRWALGPVVLGVWLPAGLDSLRFAPADQDRLAALGATFLEWLQRTGPAGQTAETLAMDLCRRTGMRMPVYYEPPGFTPYDKLHNWAARPVLDEGFDGAVRERIRALRRRWDPEPGFAGYLVGHEDYDRSLYPALARVVALLRQEDPLRTTYVAGRLDQYPSVDRFLDAFCPAGEPSSVFQHEHYVFRAEVPQAGAALQRRLGELAAGYDRVARLLRQRAARWHAIIQVHGETRDGRVYYRPPTAAEIRVQAGLALSRGAAGTVCFLYSSGVEQVLGPDGAVRQRRVYSGLVDESGAPTERYAAVQELSRQLRELAPALAGLRWYGAFGSSGAADGPLLSRADPDLEFGAFGDGVQVTHLLVVNRRTEGERVARLGMRRSEVIDAATGAALEVREGEVSLTLEPGGFRLLAMH